MQTLTIELTGKNSLKALQELEDKNLIRIVKETGFNSVALPGDSFSEEEFRNWVKYAEGSQTVNIEEAKARWEVQKKKLRNSTP